MHPALAESFELSVPPEAAIASVMARLCAPHAKPGSVSFRAHAQPDRFYLDRWYAIQGVRTTCSVLVTVRPDRDGCVLTLAPVEEPPPSDARRAAFMVWLWLFLLPMVWFKDALLWLGLGPALVGVFARNEARAWPDEHQREIAAALSRIVADVRRGGYRTPAPGEPQAEGGPAPDVALTLSPRDAVTHAAAHVGEGERIVFRPHHELGCFVVERRRLPGERGGPTLVEVSAHGDDLGCRLELRPHEPNLWFGAGGLALVLVALAGAVWSPLALHFYVPLTVAVHFARKRHRRRLQPRIDRDRAEIAAAVTRAFAPVRRALPPAQG